MHLPSPCGIDINRERVKQNSDGLISIADLKYTIRKNIYFQSKNYVIISLGYRWLSTMRS